MLNETSNFIKKSILYVFLKTPDVRILPDWLSNRTHKIFSRFYSHELSLSDLEVNYDPSNPDLITEVSKKVNKFGLVVLKDFMDRDSTKIHGQEIFDYISSKYLVLDKEYHEFDDGCVVQKEPYKIKGYDSFLNKKSTLINIRGRKNVDGYIGDDSGLIDIFHAKKIVPQKNKKIFEDFESNTLLNKIIKTIDSKLFFQSINFYFNKTKTDPRGLHIDTPTKEFKLFLYLTDVLNSNDGPYTYVPKSHKRTFLSLFNMLINKLSSRLFLLTDSSFTLDSQAIEICGKAGDLIISNQSGIHGGTPQDENSSRLILVGIIH